jgi:hypothetical protein
MSVYLTVLLAALIRRGHIPIGLAAALAAVPAFFSNRQHAGTSSFHKAS